MSKALFRLTAFFGAVFIITILAMVAMILGDPVAPVNVWFNRHGGTVVAVEVIAIVVSGLSAMTADRIETLREQAKAAEEQDSNDQSPNM